MEKVKTQSREFLFNHTNSKLQQMLFSTRLMKKADKKTVNHTKSDDEQFEPEYHTMKKLKLPMNRRKLNKGVWSTHQNKVYLSFLINNRASFVDQPTRRQSRVFCRLSQLLNKRRNPDQCRSHHHKLLANLNYSMDDLIAKIQRKLGRKKIKQNKGQSKIKQEQLLFPLKIEAQEPKSTKQSDQIYQQDMSQYEEVNEGLIEKIIEKDFYKLVVFKKSNTLLLEIDQSSIQSY